MNGVLSYPVLLRQVKQRVALPQQKAIYAANEELTTVKIVQRAVAQLQDNAKETPRLHENTITKPAVAQLPEYNYTLPIRHIHWTHNVILMQRVKDIKGSSK